ncbi:N-lysine methyltransferase SETD6 isoform X4 [Macaca nemestrina]|uniref:N-lysine methyltransferase SETD6 isoform X4 n=1 Tax=Macaca nemestrina TaxID=9545 RepID=UPI0039B9B505
MVVPGSEPGSKRHGTLLLHSDRVSAIGDPGLKMFSVGTIPASANTGRSAAWTPKQAPRGSGAGAGPETPEVAARSTGPPGGALSDHGDPDEAPTGGGACGLRRSGSCGRFPELVPAGGAGAESQGGGQPAGHGGRLRHGGPGERAGRRAAVRGTAGRASVAAHLLHWRPAGARARRAAEPVGLGATAAGAPPRAAGPGLTLEAVLCALARAGPLGAPDVLNCLRMVATQPIPKGHEIFNTYGQMANWQLIHMYGFVEPYPDNTDDTADIQMVTVREAALQGTKTEAERLLAYERWDFLCKLEMVGEEGAFVIGREEVLTEEELITTLKVLCMPAEEFRELKDQDGGGDNKREEGSLTITNIPKLKASWRQLLRNSVLLTLQTYATDLKTDQDLLSNKEVYAQLSWREQQALQVRYGQKMILHQLLELTQVGSFPVP